MEVGVIEFAVNLASLYLSEGDLFFDVVDDHQEMFAFLGKCTFIIGDGDCRAVVFHNDGWWSEWEAEFLAECNEIIEVFGESKDSAGLCLSG